MTALIQLSDCGLRRGQTHLFKQFSAEIQPNALTLLHGPNGAGKSSLLQLLAGLIEPLVGRVDYAELSPQDIRYISHHNGLWPFLTVWENACMAAHLLGGADQADIAAALAYFDLSALKSRMSAHCSAGQKRRLALSRLCLSPRAKLWLLDEPFASLDPNAIARVWPLMQAHVQQQGAIVMSCHHLDFPELAAWRQLGLAHNVISLPDGC